MVNDDRKKVYNHGIRNALPFFVYVLMGFLLMYLSPFCAHASGFGAIQGRITDQMGNPLANCIVKVAESQHATFYMQFPSTPFQYPPWVPEGLSIGEEIYSPYYIYSYPSGTESPVHFSTTSLADGSYSLINIPEGRYILWAYDTQGGYAPALFGLDDGATSIPVSVKAGLTSGPFDLVIKTGGRISGSVQDKSTGSSVGPAIVQASPILDDEVYTSSSYLMYSSQPLFIVISDETGNFTFPGLPAGKYKVSVIKADGYIVDIPLYYGYGATSSSGLSGDETIYQIAGGDVIAGCILPIQRGCEVYGTITNKATGEPVAGAMVTYYWTSTEDLAYTYPPPPVYSNEDGTYSISGLRPGAYVPVVQGAEGFYSVYYPGTRTMTDAEEISIAPETITGPIDFELSQVTSNGQISGTIVDEKTGAPLQGIWVYLQKAEVFNPSSVTDVVPQGNTGTSASPATPDSTSSSALFYLPPLDDTFRSVATDEEGRFVFSYLENGKYWLDIMDSSNIYVYFPWSNKSEDTRYINISADQPVTDIRVALKKGGTIKGLAADGDTPLAGIQVEASRIYDYNSTGYYSYGYLPHTAISDTAGEFEIPGLEEGKYILKGYDLMNRGYMTGYYYDQGNELQIIQDQTLTGIVVSMEIGATLSGTVSDNMGNPLSGIRIQADGAYTNAADPELANTVNYYIEPVYAVSAADGTYTLKGLFAGMYTITTNDPHAIYLTSSYTDIAVASEGGNVLDITLSLGGVISGRVTDQQGAPLSGISISANGYPSGDYSYPDHPGPDDISLLKTAQDVIYEPITQSYGSTSTSALDEYGNYDASNYYSTFTATTKEDGTYSLTGLPGGDYQVMAEDYAGEFVAYTLENGDTSNAVVVTVSEGEEKGNVDLSLARGCIIKGTIRDLSSGEPIPDMVVMAEATETVTDGTNTEPQGYAPRNRDEEPPAEGESDITVQNDVTPPEPSDIIGVEPDYGSGENGYPNVILSGTGMAYNSATSDKDGHFTIKGLIAGQYTISVSRQKGYQAQFYSGASRKEEATMVEAAFNQIIEGIDFGLIPGKAISGRLFDASTGELITMGHPVMLMDENMMEMESSYTTNEGSYSFSGLSPGTYYIQIPDYYSGYGRGYCSAYYSIAGTDPDTPSPIILQTESIDGIDVYLYPKAEVSGKVVYETDQTPLSGIWVMAIPAETGGQPAYFWQKSATTDIEGLYALVNLDEGDYMIAAIDPEYIYAAEYYQDVPLNQMDQATVIHINKSQTLTDIVIELHVGESYNGKVYYPNLLFDNGSGSSTQPNMYGGYSYYGLPGGGSYGSSTDMSPQALSQELINAAFMQDTQEGAIISSEPGDTVTAGREFTYQVELEGTDAQDYKYYALNHGPEEMTIDPDTGLVQWEPTNQDAGDSIIQVAAYNGQGDMLMKSFHLSVAPDFTPPDEIRNLLARNGDRQVRLSWTPSKNSAGDLSDQILYIDKGQGLEEGISLGKTASEYVVEGLKNGARYTFRIATRDILGNESEGAATDGKPKKAEVFFSNLPYPLYAPQAHAGAFGLNDPFKYSQLWLSSIWRSLTSSDLWLGMRPFMPRQFPVGGTQFSLPLQWDSTTALLRYKGENPLTYESNYPLRFFLGDME